MRYSVIDECEAVNGGNIGVSIFVQGCDIHCKGCFNKEIWDFDGGKEWTSAENNKLIELLQRPYIKRLSVLGGEPLASKNIKSVFEVLYMVRKMLPDIHIWLYTGRDLLNRDFIIENPEDYTKEELLRNAVLMKADFVVDGPYVEEQRSLTLAFRGSKNQRIIDVVKTIENKEITLKDLE